MDNNSEEGFVVKGVKSSANYKPESQNAKKAIDNMAVATVSERSA